jgi:hypothetical protein
MDRDSEMTAEKLLEHCKRFDIQLSAQGRDLGVDAPRSVPNAWLAAELLAHKVELLALLSGEPHQRAVREYTPFPGRVCQYCGSRDIGQSMDAPLPHYSRLTCMSCDRCIGWGPIPPELLGDLFIFPFGRHKGRSLNEIAEFDIDLLRWAASEMRESNIREAVRQFLDQLNAGTPSPGPMPAGGGAAPPGRINQ